MANRPWYESREQRVERMRAEHPDLGMAGIRRIMLFEDLEEKVADIKDINDVRRFLFDLVKHLQDKDL